MPPHDGVTAGARFLLTIEKASPDGFPRFLALANLAPQLDMGPDVRLLGRWAAETGELNQLYSLWRIGTQDHGGPAGQVTWSKAYLEQTSALIGERSGTWLDSTRRVRPVDDAQLYELRCYDAEPGNLDRFFERLNASMEIREQYSDNVGLWRVISPGLSRGLHISAYRDHAHRKDARAKCAADARWQAYVSGVRPLLQAQSSAFMVPAPTHTN